MTNTNPIFDIAPLTETVIIGAKSFQVAGLPIRILTQAAKDSPEVLALLFGGTLDGAALINKSPDLVAEFIAWGFRGGDDPAIRKEAANLPFDVQLKLLRGILSRTMLGGAGPFAAEIEGFRKLMIGDLPETETVKKFRTKATSEPSSQKSSNSSSPTDTQAPKFGT